MKAWSRRFLTIVAMSSLGLALMAQSISINLNQASIKYAIQEIEKQSGYKFIYVSTDLDTDKTVSINAHDLQEAVRQMLAEQGLTFKIEGNSIIVHRPEKNELQEKKEITIKGTIKDVTGAPIIGATIKEKGTSNGTITDMDGMFTLDIAEGAIFEVSYIGYQPQQIKADKQQYNIVLEEESQKLEEVVVVGYGTRLKKDVTSAISKVGGEDIAALASPSFDTQLAGRAAGVQVTTPSGVLGAGPQFKIRGMSTISSGSQPLFIIDGMPLAVGNNGDGPDHNGLGRLSTQYNSMADINPSDIESIEILKDGAATAIYGSRAANGVVLITTKKGKVGRTKVSYDGYVSMAHASKLHELLNAEQFVMIANEKARNKGKAETAVYDPNGPDTNWNDYIYQTGLQHSHSVSASGGSENGQYYASLGYTNQEGIIRSNTLERFSAKFSTVQQATKWMRMGIDGQLTRTTMNGISNGEISFGGVGFSGVRMLPNVSVYDNNDPTGYNIDDIDKGSLGRGQNKAIISNGLANIIWSLDNNINRTSNTRVIGGGWLELKLAPGLTFKTQAGLDIAHVKDFSYWSPESGEGLSKQGQMHEVYSIYTTWNWQNVIDYNHTFAGLHNLSLTGVQEYTKSEQEYTGTTVSQISDSFFNDHIISNTFEQKDVEGGKTMNGLASYLFRANYNYDSRYYIGGSIRYDGLSRLPSNSRWGAFWGASGAWRISREKFWAENGIGNWFTDLRLRASYATIGNSEIGNDFPYLGTFGPQKYGDMVGIAWNRMGNSKLKWETTSTFDVGIDGSFLNGRVSFELAYWQKDSKDLVLEVPTAPGLGIPNNSYFDNIGKIRNSGIELTVGSTVIRTKDWQWQTDINFSTAHNEVLKLYSGNDIVDSYTIIREGESYRSLYGYDYYGVNMANGNPIWRKADGTLVQLDTFGSNKYVIYDANNPNDVSQVSSLTDEDRKVLGSTMPTWYGGWSNTVTFKNFDLNVFFRFSGGNKIMNATRQNSLMNMDFANNGVEILGRWVSPEQPGDGMTLKIGSGVSFVGNYTDSHYVEDADFLKLANLAIGYTFPKKWLQPIGLSNIRLYIQGQNLFTITGYSGLDPETNSRLGVDLNGMPQQRSFTLGANITF